MLIQSRLLRCLLASVMTVAFAACGQKGAPATGQQAGARVSAAVATTGDLKITGYGPDHTKAGVVFNVQPDGGAALWVRVNRSVEGDAVTVEFNGVSLPGYISGSLVTAAVPASLYAKAGTYYLYIVATRGAHSERSNGVTFVVE